MSDGIDVDKIIEAARRENEGVEIRLPDLAPHEQVAVHKAGDVGIQIGRNAAHRFGAGFAAKLKP
jgi:hypothetical protein